MKRGAFLGSTLAGAIPAYVAAAPAVPGGETMVEPHSDFDERTFENAVGRSARIRQLWENVALRPSVFANVKNALNGLQFGFAYAPESIAMATVNHGPSASYTYGDAIWAKYRIAEFVGISASPVNPFFARKNPANGSRNPDDDNSVYQDTSIEALQARGVMFLTCHTAVMEQSKALAKGGYAPSGMAPKDVAADILTHLIPQAIVIPSGVATVAVLQQRFNYSYITIQS